jgi:hypothetical protein
MTLKIFISFLSGLSLGITGFYLILSPKFKKHPYQLIGMACLFQASYFFSYFDIFQVCEYNTIEYIAYNLGLWKLIGQQGLFKGFSEWVFYSHWKENYYTPEMSYRLFKFLIICWKVMVITFTYL